MTLSPRQSGRDILLLHSILQKNFDKVFSTAVLVGPDVTRPERSQHFLTEYVVMKLVVRVTISNLLPLARYWNILLLLWYSSM